MPFPTESIIQLSVIIPVYNDTESLQQCLDALTHQEDPGTAWEIIVVDNNSSPPITNVVDVSEKVRVFHEPTPGSYAARNRGIDEARGELLAFTDADCLPSPSWLAHGLAHMRQTSSDIAGGRIDMIFQDEQPNVWEYYDAASFLRQEKYVLKHHFGATANLFVRRDAILRYGRFDPSLRSGGDAEFCKRLVSQGATLSYAENACIRHPARYRFRQIIKKLDRVSEGIEDRSTDPPSPPKLRMLLPPRSIPPVDGVSTDASFRWKLRGAYTLIRWYLFIRALRRYLCS